MSQATRESTDISQSVNPAQLATIRDSASELESAIVEIKLCYHGWRKLIDFVEAQTLKDIMFWIADDLHSAIAEAESAHQKLWNAQRAATSGHVVPS